MLLNLQAWSFLSHSICRKDLHSPVTSHRWWIWLIVQLQRHSAATGKKQVVSSTAEGANEMQRLDCSHLWASMFMAERNKLTHCLTAILCHQTLLCRAPASFQNLIQHLRKVVQVSVIALSKSQMSQVMWGYILQSATWLNSWRHLTATDIIPALCWETKSSKIPPLMNLDDYKNITRANISNVLHCCNAIVWLFASQHE